ncbi:MAG: hypothetical protein RL513_108 [Pseudomonadota bacterium]|jgi:hypothetical protein
MTTTNPAYTADDVASVQERHGFAHYRDLLRRAREVLAPQTDEADDDLIDAVVDYCQTENLMGREHIHGVPGETL